MSSPVKQTRWLRWAARIFGSILCAFWLLIGILESPIGGNGPPTPAQNNQSSTSSTSERLIEQEGEAQIPFTWESAGMVFFILATTAATIYAWINEKRGGGLLVILAVGFSIFALFSAGHNHAFAMLISGGPFLVSGGLFLASWRAEQKRG